MGFCAGRLRQRRLHIAIQKVAVLSFLSFVSLLSSSAAFSFAVVPSVSAGRHMFTSTATATDSRATSIATSATGATTHNSEAAAVLGGGKMALENGQGKSSEAKRKQTVPPIVWTVAGSDSGGGAGIQADLHAMHALGAHGCSVITAMTAQNSHTVTHVEYASVDMIKATISALEEDMPAAAVKLGMMGTDAVVCAVGDFLDGYEGKVVCDPVMISTSGARLMAEGAQTRMMERIFPRATMITPNLVEAEALLGRTLCTPAEVEAGAAELLTSSGASGVLIKGGHASRKPVASISHRDDTRGEGGAPGGTAPAASQTGGSSLVPSSSCQFSYCQDYWTDGTSGGTFWLTGPRVDNDNTHGTGCTLSSAAAACLALGFNPTDSVVIAKAYVTQGIAVAKKLGKGGPGPVAQTVWPSRSDCFPWVTATANAGIAGMGRPDAFPPCHRDWGVYPIVDTAEWVKKLLSLGVRDIQLRVKGVSSEAVDAEISSAAAACRASGNGDGGGGRLWVNDFWREAIKYGVYGVHLGQEDLDAAGGEALAAIGAAGLRLGVSTHSYLELARATAVRPSYISLGPVFETYSKKVAFSPRGSKLVEAWRALIDEGVPLVAIGGISLETAPQILAAGAESIAVISAITKADDVDEAVKQWNAVFAAKGRSTAFTSIVDQNQQR